MFNMNRLLRRHNLSLVVSILTTIATVSGMAYLSGDETSNRLDLKWTGNSDNLDQRTSIAADTSDVEALVAFYGAFRGTDWFDNSGWLLAPNLADWHGVIVTNGRVTGIELPDNNLTGTDLTEFPEFEFLELLDLSDNSIWALPDFSGINSLKSLSVENNGLDFEDLEPQINQGFQITYAPQRPTIRFNSSTVFEGKSGKIKHRRGFGGEFNQYQWYLDSVALEGETTDSLIIAQITPTTIGPYYLEISNTLATDLTLQSSPVLFSLIQDFEIQWLDIGAYHHSYHIDGGKLESHDEEVEGMAFPAIIRNAGHIRSRTFSIGVKDWVSPEGREYPFYVYRNGGRLFRGIDPNNTSPLQHELIGRYEDTRVEINGKMSRDNPAVLDEINPGLAADRMIQNINRTDLGITIDRKIYAYANEYHDNYHLIDYEFCNTGNVDGDDEVELPNQTLREVYFHWRHGWRGSEQAAWGTSNAQVWGRYTIHDVVGDGFAEYPVDFQAQYSWTGTDPSWGFWGYDNMGGPLLRSNHPSIAPGDSVGRLADANMVGRSTIHADRSASDPSYDTSQPSIMQWISNDDPFNSQGTHREVYENTLISPEMFDDDRLCVGCHRAYPHFADRENPEGSFWASDPVASLTNRLAGGLSPTTGYGPYDMGPNECINITVSEGIGGLSFNAATKIGMTYKANGSSRESDQISFDANGDGVISDEPFNYDEVFLGTERQTKNQWVMSARDSLFQTFYRARDAYQASNDMSDYPIAEPPRAPSEFKLWSRPPNQIDLEWLPASGGPAILSWELYRSKDREDNLYITGCLENPATACGYELVASLPSEIRNYTDTNLNPATDYFYYLQGVGANQTEDDKAISGTPGGVPLRSGRYFTQTYTGISPSDLVEVDQEIPLEISLGSNFPNPFSDETTLQYLLSTSSDVQIFVYDLLGQRLISMEMGMQEAGLHNAILRIEGLASGAYIYVLVAGEQRVDGMMVKLR